MLTCKSLVEFRQSGERPIELSSSWFLPKFPSGQLAGVCVELRPVKHTIGGIGELRLLDRLSNSQWALVPPPASRRTGARIEPGQVGHFW